MSNKYDLTIYQGSTFEFSMRVKDSNGTPMNLTGYTGAMQIRSSYGAANPAVSLSTGSGITINVPSSTINVAISAADTAAISVDRSNGKPPKSTYVYDFELTDAQGKISKLLYGDVTVFGEVTR